MRRDSYHNNAETHAIASLNRTALRATIHCLTGCAIGEVAGMIIGTALGWRNAATFALAIGLAFATGYAFTIFPLLRAGLPGNYPPAKPGALICEPLKAAYTGSLTRPRTCCAT